MANCDITYCLNTNCPLAHNCERKRNAPVIASYCEFKWIIVSSKWVEVKCDFYKPIKEDKK